MNVAGGFEALETAGPLLVWTLVCTFVFLECALIIGLFLPGDSMLITAGIVLSSHAVGPEQAWALSVGAVIAAIAGNQVGYVIGRRGGSRLLARKQSKHLNARNVERVNEMLDRHGFWAVFVSRWVPWVRTLCPLVAGAAGMNHRKYTIASTLGAILWAPVLILIGFYAGTFIERVPWLMPTVLIVMIVGLVAGVVLGIRNYRREMALEAVPAVVAVGDEQATN